MHFAVLEMDFAIDRTGRVAPSHEARYRQFGSWITSCYGHPVTSAGTTSGGNVTLTLPSGATIDRVVIQEDQAQGQRIRGFSVDAQSSGSWTTILTGTGVGNKYIGVASSGVTGATSIRLRVTSAIAEPQLLHFGVYAPCPSS